MEKVYNIFTEILCVIVDDYTHQNHNYFVNEIVIAVKNVYSNKKIFKYVMERYYANHRNPFTTAYSQFMNNLGVMTLDECINDISHGLLSRLLKEQQTGNEFVVF